MMLAESDTPTWQSTLAVLAMLAGGLGLLCTGLMVYYMKRQTDLMADSNSRPASNLPQPLAVELVEELHEQFASKKVFEEHAAGNTKRHGEIFSEIRRVETHARESLHREITQINADRKQSLESLGRKNERMMFALGKIAQKLNEDIEPTE